MTASDADLVVVGGGPGGYVAALRAADAGMATVLVEEGELGGVCLNAGCVPSKALIHAAEGYAGHGVPPGVGPSEPAVLDLDALRRWQDQIVSRLRRGVGQLLAAANVTVVRGTGRLDGPGRVVVTGHDATDLRTRQVILATGSRPRELTTLPYDGVRVVSSTEALHPPATGGRLVVVGGGYIGLELASAYLDLGWAVTVVEATGSLLGEMDPVLGGLVERELRRRGATVLLTTRVTADDGEVLSLEGEGQGTVPADLVVVAVGRAPRSDGIGLDSVRIATDAGGFVPVDAGRRTSADRILAIGDLTPGIALAHAAMQEGTVAGEVAAGLDRVYDPAAVPAVVYTRPELATVGLTPAAAAARGVEVDVHEVPMGANARAQTLGATGGLCRVVVARDRGLILGAQLAGPGVGELVGTMALAIEMGATVEDLAGTILPHPSVSEVLTEAAHVAVGAPRHVPARGS